MNAKRWEIGLGGVQEVLKKKEVEEEVPLENSDEEGECSIQVGIREDSRKTRTGSHSSKRSNSSTTDKTSGFDSQENSDPTPPNTSNPDNVDPEDCTVISGASITAFATSIFQRLRLLDGINYKQI